MNSITAIVLCGGVGSRLKSIVKDIPKPLAEVNGLPFLDILLKWMEKSNFQRYILIKKPLNQ